MPVIPNLSTFVPAPNLAQSYLAQQRLQQEAAADAARIQLGYATLRQRAVEAEMETAAKKEIVSRQAIQQAQEAEVEKAYRQQQFGLAERGLKQQEMANAMKLQQAASDFAAEQEYNRLIAAKVSPQEAMQRVGFGRPGFTASLTERTVNEVPRLTLENRILQQQKEDLLRPYSVSGVQMPIPPEVQSQIDALSKRQTGMLTPATTTGTNAPAQPKRLKFNIKTGEFE